MIEQTLVIVKPDAMKKKLSSEILGRFEKSGLSVKEFNIVKLNKEFVSNFYSHLNNKIPPKMIESIHDFMTSYKVMAVILEGEDAVQKVRKLVGPTDPSKAPKGTIRGDFSDDVMAERDKKQEATQNAVHASGNIEEAQKEIAMIKEFIDKY